MCASGIRGMTKLCGGDCGVTEKSTRIRPGLATSSIAEKCRFGRPVTAKICRPPAPSVGVREGPVDAPSLPEPPQPAAPRNRPSASPRATVSRPSRGVRPVQPARSIQATRAGGRWIPPGRRDRPCRGEWMDGRGPAWSRSAVLVISCASRRRAMPVPSAGWTCPVAGTCPVDRTVAVQGTVPAGGTSARA